MYDIEIRNEQDHVEVDEEHLRSLIHQCLLFEEVARAEISLAVVDNRTIWRLNKRHLQHDYPTDVLSFLLDCTHSEGELDCPRGRNKQLSGEIIVSAEMATQMAFQYQWKAGDELSLYVVHGLLHLCGYDDLTEEELLIMRQREREVLAAHGLSPVYAASQSPEDSSKNAQGSSL